MSTLQIDMYMIADRILERWRFDTTLEKRVQLQSRQLQRQHRFRRVQAVDGFVGLRRVRLQLDARPIPADLRCRPRVAHLAGADEPMSFAQRTERGGI